MFSLVFKDKNEDVRCIGSARVPYSSNTGNETIVKTTEDDLASIFEDAKANGETLDGDDESIDAAVEEPLFFTDYLILEGETITFDNEYARDSDPGA